MVQASARLRETGQGRFPLSKKALRERIVLPHAHCPICELKQAGMRYVHARLYDLTEPMDILSGLKLNGHVPRDIDNHPIQTADDWNEAIAFHMVQCISQDPHQYRSGVQAKLTKARDAMHNARLQRSLQRRLAEEDVQATLAATDNDLCEELSDRDRVMVAESTVNEGGIKGFNVVTPVSSETPITRDALVSGLQDMLPNIILNQMLIIKREQERYMSGEIDTPPTDQIRTLTGMQTLLHKMLGDYGMNDTVAPD